MKRSYYRDGAGMVIEALEMRVMLSADGFIKAAGTVLRCASCENVQVRLVRAADRAWLDLRGVRVMQIPLADGA